MLAHAADASGWGMLAFIPVGFLLLVGLIIVLRPVVTGIAGTEEREEDDLASQLLGADAARELRRKARRRRAVHRIRRRASTTTTSDANVSPNGTRKTLRIELHQPSPAGMKGGQGSVKHFGRCIALSSKTRQSGGARDFTG